MAYAQKRKFTINNAQVGGSSGTITDYPVLISGTFAGTGSDPDLRTTANGGSIQNTDATGGASGGVTVPADLAFYNDLSGTTKYDHEVVSYTATTGQFEAWVRIPTLNKASDTDFYMHYSDSGVTTSQENIGGTWEANYRAVYHLGESSGSRYDSSGNTNTLTDNNTVPSATGKVGTGADFESTNSESLSAADSASLSVAGDMTLLFWMKPEDYPTNAGAAYFLVSKDDGTAAREYFIQIRSDSDLAEFAWWGAGAATFSRFRSDAAYLGASDVGNWIHLAVHVDVSAADGEFYKNGSNVATSQNLTAATSMQDNTAVTYIGANNSSGTPANFYDGVMDEVKIYSGILDADYILTVYNNENSPSTFYSISTLVADVNVSVEDTATISETVTVSVGAIDTFAVSVTETVTLTEETTISVQEATPLSLSVEETATISETVTLATDALTISVAETATITDEPSIFVEDANNTFSLTVTETITITETVSGSGFGHNSTLWTDVTNKRGNVWTSSNDYKADD